MVRPRRGTKRVSPKQLEDGTDQCDVQEKKSKLDDNDVKSKYFENETESSNSLIEGGTLKRNKDDSDSDDSVIFNRTTKKLSIKAESDSESSSDEFMKVPFSLDDLGDFETLKTEITDSKDNVQKAVSSSSVSRLSDNSDSEKDSNKVGDHEYYDFSQIIQSQEFITNTKKEQEEKASCKPITPKSVRKKSNKISKKGNLNLKIKFESIGEELGISELLAITEGPSLNTTGGSKCSESESEIEDIKTKETSYSVPKEGVQVTIELPNVQQKRKSKGFDIEAAMKRRLNLIRKENQILMHKVHTLCWLAHGMYLNSIINSEYLIALALSLIPSKHCYPSKHADLDYLEKLVEWFGNKIAVDQNHKLSLNSSKLPLLDVLETEINSKVAFSQRDLVLIFVCLVRSLGIDARLIISLRSVPLRPPASDLCTVSNKPKETNINDAKLKNSTSPTKEKRGKGNKKEKVNCKLKQPEVKSTRQLKKSLGKSSNKSLSEIKSPYFSSSDELPLTNLINTNLSRKSVSTGEGTSKTQSPQTILPPEKSSNIDKTRKKIVNKSSSVKSSNLISDCQDGKEISKYKLSEKNMKRNVCNSNKSTTQLESDSDLLLNKPIRNRKSVVASVCEITSTSSEDEVEIPNKISNRKKRNSCKTDNNSNIKKIESSKINGNLSNAKIFESPKGSNSKKKSIDRRVLSSDEDISNNKKIGNDFWAEIFLEAEEKWITVDLRKKKVHCIHQLYNGATQPVRYVIAWNNDGSMKDVTRRYAPQWLTVTRRQRADDSWWKETMAPFISARTLREREEDEDLDKQLHDKPLPSNIAEYKNHPLFALRRHLLKFEAIYPPNAPPLGFIRNEPVYSRGCVVELHTRETWIKDAKLVRRDEEPYKIVKARPKYDKLSGRLLNDLPLPLFGRWQVEDYIPPPAVDGKVPRNEYGNVELYKPCMLPSGTVHLQVPQLARVARKLGIDCAPAVVGWEFSGGSSHPVLDGFIVCEEFKEVLLDAWNKEMDESAKRAKEKVEQRVYGNWKRLIKGLLIRERLKLRYDFGVPEPEKKKKKQQPKPSTSKS